MPRQRPEGIPIQAIISLAYKAAEAGDEKGARSYMKSALKRGYLPRDGKAEHFEHTIRKGKAWSPLAEAAAARAAIPLPDPADPDSIGNR